MLIKLTLGDIELNTKISLNSNQLKIIAISAMVVDHVTWLMFPGFQSQWYVLALHAVGRLTAPIMWYLLSEGFFYTKNPKKYISRLFVFAFFSHFAYKFAFGLSLIPDGIFNQTSVIWSLALSALLMYILDKKELNNGIKIVIIVLFCLLSFPADWSTIAMMAPVMMYHRRDNKLSQMKNLMLWTLLYALIYFVFIDKTYGLLQLFTNLSIPLLLLYNGKKGSGSTMKWFYYYFYPLHLVVLGMLRLIIYGNISILF